MTKEEYRLLTEIKDIDEAKHYLSKLNSLFTIMFIGVLAVKGLDFSLMDESVYWLLLFAYLALLVYFVFYCKKIIKMTKNVTSAYALWAILFAPISWLWFYPDLTKPLKIIIGSIPVPEKRRQ